MSGVEQSAESGPGCLVVTDGHGTECGHPAEGSVYDESDQCEVPSCSGHIVSTARGRVADYRPMPPGAPS